MRVEAARVRQLAMDGVFSIGASTVARGQFSIHGADCHARHELATIRPDAEGAWILAPPDGFEPPTPALGRLRSIH